MLAHTHSQRVKAIYAIFYYEIVHSRPIYLSQMIFVICYVHNVRYKATARYNLRTFREIRIK